MVVKTAALLALCVTLGCVIITGIANFYSSASSMEDRGARTLRRGEGLPHPRDGPQHLVWFVQISDLHFSNFFDQKRKTDFEKFCKFNLHVIRPSLILATGDLTDAKFKNLVASKQFVEEWNSYKDIIHRTGISRRIPWLDIRGNHDNFNVLSVNSSQNYFRTHSVQGKWHNGSYVYTLKNGFDKYNFIGVDACPKIGLRRPFNFVGVLNKDDYSWLEKTSKQRDVNGTIWFGHYTTSTILSSYPGIRHLMRNGFAYLCGHLHTMYDTVPQMHAYHRSGLLELEVGDWKDYRMFRVAAIDHDLFSFVDVKLGQWPIILITNPKHAAYISPNVEPIYRIGKSTHVRILVFSPFNVTKVVVKIGNDNWKQAYAVKPPLYVLSWQPNSYRTGLHNLQVFAQDQAGNNMTQKILFSIDGTRPELSIAGRFLLMSHVTWFQVLFGIQVFSMISAICCLRFLHFSSRYGQVLNSTIFLRYMKIMTSIDRLFYPLLLMIIYPIIGPWFIGNLSEDKIGAVFVWGIVVSYEFIPGSLGYVYGCFQIVFFILPLSLALTQSVKYRIQRESCDTSCNIITYVKRHIFIILAVMYQLRLTSSFCTSYGSISVIFSFAYSWYIALALLLWSSANTLPKDLLQKLGVIR